MNYEEFLQPKGEEANKVCEEPVEGVESEETEQTVETTIEEEMVVQQAVVESLAAEKVEQDETIAALKKDKDILQQQKTELENEILLLKQKVEEQKAALEKVADVLSINGESVESNKIALLDRDFELPDRFPGETRDQVLEAIALARDLAEKEGRVRRAQVLEAVLVANEPSGNLAKKRATLEKFFNDNQNILSGLVIEELQKAGISHKKGEEYLLPSEILLRTY